MDLVFNQKTRPRFSKFIFPKTFFIHFPFYFASINGKTVVQDTIGLPQVFHFKDPEVIIVHILHSFSNQLHFMLALSRNGRTCFRIALDYLFINAFNPGEPFSCLFLLFRTYPSFLIIFFGCQCLDFKC